MDRGKPSVLIFDVNETLIDFASFSRGVFPPLLGGENVVHLLLAAALVAVLSVSPLAGREAIILSAAPSGFFGILFGLRYGVVSQDAGSTLIASTVLSAATIPAAILLTAETA